jgi:hypothetical protein
MALGNHPDAIDRIAHTFPSLYPDRPSDARGIAEVYIGTKTFIWGPELDTPAEFELPKEFGRTVILVVADDQGIQWDTVVVMSGVVP